MRVELLKYTSGRRADEQLRARTVDSRVNDGADRFHFDNTRRWLMTGYTWTEWREALAQIEWMDAYLKALTGCPFCGKDETSPIGYVRNHFMFYTLPSFHDGAGCIRLHVLGNQTRYAARQGDDRWLEKYTEITRYQGAAAKWPVAWFENLQADLADMGVLDE